VRFHLSGSMSHSAAVSDTHGFFFFFLSITEFGVIYSSLLLLKKRKKNPATVMSNLFWELVCGPTKHGGGRVI